MTPVEIVTQAFNEDRRLHDPFWQPRPVTLAHIAVQALQRSGHLNNNDEDQPDG